MFWLLLAALAGGVGGWAQMAGGAAVRGRVSDVGGVGLAGVRVRLWRADAPADGPETVTATTDGNGVYLALGLRDGLYRLTVCLPRAFGCEPAVAVEVATGEVTEADVRLAAGGLRLLDGDLSAAPEDSLAETPVLQRRCGTAGEAASVAKSAKGLGAAGQPGPAAAAANGSKPPGALDGVNCGAAASVGALPVRDRDWAETEETAPAGVDTTLADRGTAQGETAGEGTAAARAGEETGSAATGQSYAGLPVTQNAETVDGVSDEQGFGAGVRGASLSEARVGSSFAEGAVARVRVSAGDRVLAGFSAQVGGAGGAVQVTSRRAEARLHGDVFGETRQSGWAAVNPFAVVTRYQAGTVYSELIRPTDEDTHAGAAMGVPFRLPGGVPLVRGWRGGVFGTAEVQRRNEMLVSTPETANFFELSPEQRSLLGNRGVTAAEIGAALGYLSGLTGVETVQSPRLLGFARLDLAAGRRDGVWASGNVGRATEPATGASGLAEGITDRAASSIGSGNTHTEAVTAGWEHLFPARAANSVRVQLAHELEFETAPVPGAGVPAISPGGFAPQVTIGPEGFVYGTPATLGRVAYPEEWRVEVGENFQLRLGRQVVTLGGDWSRVRDRIADTEDTAGAFNYDSGTTGGYDGGLVDWITDYTFNVHAYPNGGCPHIYSPVHDFCFRSYTQSFATAAPTQFATHHVSGYAEDAVRLGRSLRVTAGARYEYLLLPFPQVPNPALDALLRELRGAATGVTATFPEDRNNVGPRVAVAWTPGLRGRRWATVQAGYGVFYGRLPGATIDAALTRTAMPGESTTTVRVLPTTEVDCPQVGNQGFGYPCAFQATPTGVVAQTTGAMVFANRFRLPATQRGTFAVEREIGRSLFVRAEYATAWTTQLPESADINIAPSTSVARYQVQGGNGRKGLVDGQTFAVPAYTERLTTKYGTVTEIRSNANATYHAGTVEAQLRDWHGWSARGSFSYAKAIDYGPQVGAWPRLNGQFDPFSDGYDKGLSSLDFPTRMAGALVYRSTVREGAGKAWRALGQGWSTAVTGTAGSGAPYSYVVFGGTRLNGGRESINGSGGATYLPTVGRNTLRLPRRSVANVRLGRELPMGGRFRLRVQADAFNVMNAVSLSRVETRAFLVGTPAVAGGLTPLVFQDQAAVLSEGVATPAFGTPLSSTSGQSRERQVQLGARLSF